jgi:hypothetical protein
MYHVHPIIALDLARDRSREHEIAAERWRLAALATSGQADAGPGPSNTSGRPGGGRRAMASALRAVAAASANLAGSAGRAASRLEGGPA